MELNDLTFLFTIMSCSFVASNYKTLDSPNIKKLYGSFIGLLAIFLISGPHIVHPIFITMINSIIILNVNKRYHK